MTLGTPICHGVAGYSVHRAQVVGKPVHHVDPRIAWYHIRKRLSRNRRRNNPWKSDSPLLPQRDLFLASLKPAHSINKKKRTKRTSRKQRARYARFCRSQTTMAQYFCQYRMDERKECMLRGGVNHCPRRLLSTQIVDNTQTRKLIRGRREPQKPPTQCTKCGDTLDVADWFSRHWKHFRGCKYTPCESCKEQMLCSNCQMEKWKHDNFEAELDDLVEDAVATVSTRVDGCIMGGSRAAKSARYRANCKTT